MEGYKAVELNLEDQSKGERSLWAQCQAVSDMKFTYVVSCQQYGIHKRSGDPRAQDILRLMTTYPSLRVAYIDELEEPNKDNSKKVNEKAYYSCLVKAALPNSNSSDPVQNLDQIIYKIKLPGPAILGEGKPENQNHAIIFTRGEGLQTIDMNQDNYMEEALKMRNLLQEFLKKHDGVRHHTILGLREHIFTGRYLAKILAPEGSKDVAVGQPIAITVEDPADIETVNNSVCSGSEIKEAKPTHRDDGNEAKAQKTSVARISPSAKLLITEYGLDLSSLKASGSHGLYCDCG
ncbi:callose synthase 3-like isoform X2 [Quercus robur]|uniref:callose synthase 3-like isoform X2 n=1 Tax=Quercus robur TaxID=38942 RepID=UPI002162AB31|nr:callose synthase 3-like isoform X2 [Quercus robur]